MNPTPTDLPSLLALERIKRVKACYCRYVDTKQWERLRALFTDDAVFDGFGSAPSGSSVDAFVSGISARMATAVSVHHCHMPEIVMLGPDLARGVWAMMDVVDFGAGQLAKEAPGARGFTGLGHYEDEYRQVGGEWLISYTRLTRLRLDPLPDAFPAARADLLAVSTDWLSGGPRGDSRK